MDRLNVSLPAGLKDFVEEQAASHGYESSDAYLRELVRREWDRQSLRRQLLAGAASSRTPPADETWFDALRARARRSGAA